MLALSKALILRPKLLIIDEFSLGLAPKVVGELLPIVSELNAGGSAVLLVEQSVNIALSIADHAYCMEKGEIVYDGSADRLRDDPELMRAVYLEGVSKALSV
jgi:branched-chain amino acid transport system ATP-binding protein